MAPHRKVLTRRLLVHKRFRLQISEVLLRRGDQYHDRELGLALYSIISASISDILFLVSH